MTTPEQPTGAPAGPIRIGLVDDQPLVRAGFAMLLGSQEDLDVAWQASDGDEVLDLARAQPADIVLMDVQMSRVNGIAATERLLPEFPDTQVIMLTTFDDQNFVHGAISAGASGFLLKDVEPEELLAAIRTVHSGEAVLSPRITAQVLQQLRSEQSAAQPDSPATPVAAAATAPPAEDLTPRELDVLKLMALGHSNT
ncbi:MAG: response regulator transcription factor, partial [Corynebacterium sp.]|nr:response regulator transcription factor [Corynebacterium sp.]